MPRRTVLVVEDNPLLRDDAVTLLEQAGFNVVEIETADEALAYVCKQAGHVAAVFTDLETPGNADGYDLARMIGQNWPEIAVLVTSGRRGARNDCPPNARFLPKPWLPLDVLVTMQGAVARH